MPRFFKSIGFLTLFLLSGVMIAIAVTFFKFNNKALGSKQDVLGVSTGNFALITCNVGQTLKQIESNIWACGDIVDLSSLTAGGGLVKTGNTLSLVQCDAAKVLESNGDGTYSCTSFPMGTGTTYTASNGIVLVGNNFSPSYGSTSGTIAQGNDPRFHDPVTVGTANGLSLTTQVLSLGLADASNNGALSSTDWNTFNNKVTSLTSGTGIGLSGTTQNPIISNTGVLNLNSLTAGITLAAGSGINIANGVGTITISNTVSSVGGSGTINYLPKFTASTTLGDSQIFDDGSKVGIGTATPPSKLSIVDVNTLASPLSSAVDLTNVVNTAGVATVRGIVSSNFFTAVGTLDKLIGTESKIFSNVSGADITTASSYYAGANIVSGAHIGTLNLSEFDTPINSGSVDSLRALYIKSMSSGGVINTGAWAIYQEDANDKSYFAGSVGIGTATPTSFKLQIAGDIGPNSAPSYATVTATHTSVDTVGDVGSFVSNVIGGDGLLVTSYYDATNTALNVIKCGNSTCSSGNTITPVDTGSVGQYTSITLGSDGLPVISYYDTGNGDLKVAECGDTACSSGNTITTVDSTGNVGQMTAIALGANGFPFIAYTDVTNSNLKVVSCGNAACSSGNTITTIDSGGTQFGSSSIVVTPDKYPLIAYRNITGSTLKTAKCSNQRCTAVTLTTVDASGTVDVGTSITLDSKSLPAIGYQDIAGIKLARCTDYTCTSSTNSSLSSPASQNLSNPSIKKGSDGNLLLLYAQYGATDHLPIIVCKDYDCTNTSVVFADSTVAQAGAYLSMAIGNDGLPMISANLTNNPIGVPQNDLRITKCASYDCAATTGTAFSGGSNLGSRGSYFNNVFAAQYWGKSYQISDFADLAEKYKVDDYSIEAGDIVRIKYGKTVEKADKINDEEVLGIISTNPGITLASEDGDRPVALSGRVPVKVTTSAGEIHKGDLITTSLKPGLGQKSIGRGWVVGKALEDYKEPDKDKVGTILIFTNLTYYIPAGEMTASFTNQDVLTATDPRFTDLITKVSDIENQLKDGTLKAKVGTATLITGNLERRVVFDKEFSEAPVVNITPSDDLNSSYYVTDVLKTGFTIKIKSAEQKDVVFNWSAQIK